MKSDDGLMGAALAQSELSDLNLTAVDEEFDAVDEAGLVGREKQHGLRDLLRLADPAGGDLAGQIILGTLCLVTATEQLVETGGLGHARTDRIDADVAIPEVQDPVAREVAHRRLAGGIDAESRRP